jgi:hypothetical protein
LVMVSMASPRVCPKFSICLIPVSCRSFWTTASLHRMQRLMRSL